MSTQDEAGAFTRATGRSLEDNSGQLRYRGYQFSLIAPHCGPSVLEVGSGLGEFASQFSGLDRLVLTDVDPSAVAALRRRFARRVDVEVRTLDLDLDGEVRLEKPVASVVAVNVLEHIEDDVAALRALARLVAPGGTIVLWVPAFPALFGDFDRRVGHFRRYTPRTLRSVVQRAGLTAQRCHAVNFLGGVAWWAAVRIGGAGNSRPGVIAAYDRLVVPVTRLLERRWHPPFGQSVLCVARTPGA